MTNPRLLSSIAAALSLAGSLACAQGVLAPQPAAPQDKLSIAASSLGIKRCLPAIQRLSALSLQGARSHDLLLDWDRKRPDSGATFAMLGIEYPNAGVAASITTLPEADGGCTVAAERISVAPFTCASIAQQELGGYQMTKLLAIYTVYVDPKEPNSSVSLIDSPPGCLVIRRFVEYSWKNPGAPGSATPPPKR